VIIKESKNRRKNLDPLLRVLIGHRVSMVIVVLGLYTGLFFFLGAQAHKSGLISKVMKTVSRDSIETVHNYIMGLTAGPERMIIDIKHTDFEKLRYKRDLALEAGILTTDQENYVPAKIRYGDKTIKVNLRLKGDNLDHLMEDKWSFRIKVSGDNTFLRMKQFSIQHPKTRDYIYEWLFHQTALREGLIALRYKFINVVINGKDYGIYALEENFEKRLIENNQRREGPIIKFDESLFWAERLDFKDFIQSGRVSRSLPGIGSYTSNPIDMFQTGKTTKDSLLFNQYMIAQNLLEQFRRGRLPSSQVFEVNGFSRYIALCDLFGTNHSLHTNQFRFYYNPVLSLLEPIPFDINDIEISKKLTKLAGTYTEQDDTLWDGGGRALFLSQLFKDNSFWEAYVNALERFSDPSYLDILFKELNDELTRNLNEIYSEFPWYRFSKEILYQNQAYIRKFLNPVKALYAYYHSSDKERIVLEIGNIHQIPIEIISVSYMDRVLLEPKEKVLLPPKNYSHPVHYQKLDVPLPVGLPWSDSMARGLSVQYRLLGTDRLRTETVFPWPYLNDTLIAKDVFRRAPHVNESDMLMVDEKTKKIYFRSGQWSLEQDLIIPKGYRLVAEGGVQVNLKKAAKIITFSPVTFIGSEENPVRFYSSDASGQGMAVLASGERSVLDYVYFDHLSNPSEGGWNLTGAVTFYESPVKITHCQFTRNRSEDALNIVRSDFNISHTLFSETTSDAFDSDFSKGQIIESSFIHCGNDAVDVSGTNVTLNQIAINGTGDKGLSVGENSQMTAHQIRIAKSKIAVVSKDMSELTIEGIEIKEAKIGLAAYRKKPEFGEATIAASHLQMNNVETPYLIEEGSRLTVDGSNVETNQQDVKRILYGEEDGASNR